MEKLLINTPQNVQIAYQTASLGTRFLALAIDLMLMGAYTYLVSFLLGDVLGGFSDPYTIAGLWMFLLLPVMFYHFVLESFLSGQTIGKLWMKIKVVRLDGSRASLYEYFIRWAMNLIDIWMMSGVIGLLSIILSKHSQRIGDRAAGTAVISLKPRINLNQTVYEDLADTYEPVYSEHEIRRLSDKDINLIKQSFQEANRNGDAIVMTKLAERIAEVTGADIGTHTEAQFVDSVLKDHYYYHKEL